MSRRRTARLVVGNRYRSDGTSSRIVNNNMISSTLFMDYSRAFNTVNHQILLRKMKMYGLSGNV